MSQPLHETVDVHNPAFNTGDHQYPPQAGQNQAPQGFSNFVDGSGHIFSMYLEMATEEDKKMAENWKADADGILIFTGLFSAAVASLISVSIQDLQQNPQDTSNFYLANMYQATINPNASGSLPTSPPPFTPPNYAVWVNSLWFLSLVIGLTCALLATFLQQWARRYLKVTHSRYSPHKRARIRAFFAEGVEKCLLPWAVETLPTLLHISLFLFFAGLVVFLWNVNLTIFKLVLSWVAVCTALYGCFTLMPIFRHDSPYYTSLSSSLWPIVYFLASFVSFLSGVLLYVTCWSRGGEWLIKLASRCGGSLLCGMQKTVEDAALNSPPEIDIRAFMWTFDCLDEDHELERFFAGLPGLRSSKVVDDPLPRLTWGQKWKLGHALTGLMDRTFSSDLLPASVKERRALICAKAIDPVHIPKAFSVLDAILSKCHYSGPMVPTIVQVMRGWGDNMKDISVAQATVCSIVAQSQHRDHSWFILASEALGSPEAVLRDYSTHGNSLSLAILIHLVRQHFNHFKEQHWPYYDFSKVLEAASKFDVLDTSRELQHEFCALWNEVVDSNPWFLAYILKPIRNIYLTLHLDTNSAPTAFSASTDDKDPILWSLSSYPLCNIPGHHPDSTPHIHDSATATAIARPDLHDNPALVPSSRATTPDAPSQSLPTPVRIDGSTVDVSLPNNDMSAPASSHSTHRPAAESLSDSATLPAPPAAACAAQDMDTSARTMPLMTPNKSSTLTASVFPPGEHSLQNIADLLVHSNASEIPSPASPEPALDDIMESHFSILATTPPGASPSPPFVPEIGTAECGAEVCPHEDKDTLDSPSANRAIQATTNMAILDCPRSPTLPSATDVAIASPSQRGLDAEPTGDPPPHASSGQYDIV